VDPALTDWTVVSSYLLLRAIRLLWPEKLLSEDLPVLTMCGSAAQLISSWALAPTELSVRYRDSLTERFDLSERRKSPLERRFFIHLEGTDRYLEE
jgi:hypothetical protein